MGALKLELAAQQSWTLGIPGGFQQILLGGELTPGSGSAEGGHLLDVDENKECAAEE